MPAVLLHHFPRPLKIKAMFCHRAVSLRSCLYPSCILKYHVLSPSPSVARWPSQSTLHHQLRHALARGLVQRILRRVTFMGMAKVGCPSALGLMSDLDPPIAAPAQDLRGLGASRHFPWAFERPTGHVADAVCVVHCGGVVRQRLQASLCFIIMRIRTVIPLPFTGESAWRQRWGIVDLQRQSPSTCAKCCRSRTSLSMR